MWRSFCSMSSPVGYPLAADISLPLHHRTSRETALSSCVCTSCRHLSPATLSDVSPNSSQQPCLYQRYVLAIAGDIRGNQREPAPYNQHRPLGGHHRGSAVREQRPTGKQTIANMVITISNKHGHNLTSSVYDPSCD